MPVTRLHDSTAALACPNSCKKTVKIFNGLRINEYLCQGWAWRRTCGVSLCVRVVHRWCVTHHISHAKAVKRNLVGGCGGVDVVI